MNRSKKIRLVGLIAMMITFMIPSIASAQSKKEKDELKKEIYLQKEEIKKQVEEARRMAEEELKRLPKVYHFDSFWDDKSSTLRLSKHFDGETIKSSRTFQVDDSIKKIKIELAGECEDGDIKVVILLPNGEILKEVLIDPSADLQWSHILILKEEKSKYVGSWKLKIESDDAEGKYSLVISTY